MATTPTIEEKIEAALQEGADDQTSKKKRKPRIELADVAPDSRTLSLKSFTSRELPWMQLGAQLDGEITSAAEAAKLGGLNFDVELLDVGFKAVKRSHTKGAKPEETWKIVSNRRACVRKDTGQFFSFVSKDYTPIQYGEAFAFMDEVNPHYVAAGTLGGGRQGFIVATLPDAAKINLKIDGKTDPIDWYLVLRTSHDLSRALEACVMPLRDKCMNGLAMKSFTGGAQQRWSVRHVGKDPMEKLANAKETLGKAESYVKEFERIAIDLASIKLEIDAAKDVLKKILPNRPKREDQVNAIVTAWQESNTNGFRDNGWGLTNAVSEYFEWGRNEGTRTPQSRFTSPINGPTAHMVNRTAQLLLRRR